MPKRNHLDIHSYVIPIYVSKNNKSMGIAPEISQGLNHISR